MSEMQAAYQRGDRVRYVPSHAHGDPKHPDVEYGIVSSCNEHAVFVRYYPQISERWHGFEGTTSKATDPEDLRRGWGEWVPQYPITDAPPEPPQREGTR